MKTGIFGGAFNPVHLGHIHLADVYYKELGLDRLLFIPTAKPPHKSDDNLISATFRLQMLELALADKPYEISTIELEREEISYTYDTLVILKEKYPEDEFYLIIGADQFFYFDKWYRYKDILKMARLCTLARDDEKQKKALSEYAERLNIKDSFCLIDAPVINISSTQIRNGIKSGIDISSLLPDGVYEYIKEKGLYSV